MKIIINAKNLELTQVLKTFIEKKVGSIKKFINILKQDTPEGLKTLAEVFIEVEKESKHHRKGEIFLVRAQVVLPGKTLAASANADDLFKAIIEAKDELKKEIGKYKFKKIDTIRRKQRKAKEEIEN